jgi:hypothetical protein
MKLENNPFADPIEQMASLEVKIQSPLGQF